MGKSVVTNHLLQRLGEENSAGAPSAVEPPKAQVQAIPNSTSKENLSELAMADVKDVETVSYLHANIVIWMLITITIRMQPS